MYFSVYDVAIFEQLEIIIATNLVQTVKQTLRGVLFS